MAIDLYYFTPGSGPSNLVLLVGAALDIKFNLKHVDLMKGEHLKPEFLKLNPQHTLPTIVDNGFVLWESRAICRYLLNKYGDKRNLYPSDPQVRAIIDHRLDFDLATLEPRLAQYYYPQLSSGGKADEELHKKLLEALEFLNKFLEGYKYAAGPELTLADFSLVITVSTIEIAGISLKAYPNVERWFELVKATLPNYKEVHQKSVDDFTAALAKLKQKA